MLNLEAMGSQPASSQALASHLRVRLKAIEELRGHLMETGFSYLA